MRVPSSNPLDPDNLASSLPFIFRSGILNPYFVGEDSIHLISSERFNLASILSLGVYTVEDPWQLDRIHSLGMGCNRLATDSAHLN